MKLKLSEFFVSLILKKSFYGRLASSIQRHAKPGLGTMAVGLRDGRAAFFYDPKFIEKVPLKAALLALEHEMLHLVLDHLPRYLELLAHCPTDVERAKAAAVYNIAMDAAINTMLRNNEGFTEIQEFLLQEVKENHPDAPEDPRNGFVLPEKFGLPLEGSFEFYQWQLMKKVEIQEIAMRLVGACTHGMWFDASDNEGAGDENQEGGGGGSEDGKGKSNRQGQGGGSGKNGPQDMIFDGSIFKNMTADELLSQAHRARENIKETLRQTVKQMGGIGRGLFPAGVAEWLEKYLAPPIIPWWEVFATRARMSRNSKFQRSVRVPNRALLALSEENPQIIPAPGRIQDKAWRIFFYVDTSGSMSTESLEIAKSELHHMLEVDENMEIRYMQGDAITHMDVLLKTGDKLPEEVWGRGGTDFNPYFIHMNQYVGDENTTPDLVVVYTDGGAPPVEPQNRLPLDIPVIWLVTPNHSEYFHDDYGEIIRCDPSHNERYKKAA